MNRFILVLFLSVFSGVAHGERLILNGDERFSFEAAHQAFQVAQAPSSTDLAGEWMMVGQAVIPKVRGVINGYWPDGRHPISGQPGFFYWFWNYIEKGPDSFGSPIWKVVMKLVGAETGKTYHEWEYSHVRLTSTGVKFFVRGTSSTCDLDAECRFVKDVGMLLCQSAINNASRDCAEPTGTITGYAGLVRKVEASVDQPKP